MIIFSHASTTVALIAVFSTFSVVIEFFLYLLQLQLVYDSILGGGGWVGGSIKREREDESVGGSRERGRMSEWIKGGWEDQGREGG